MQTRTTIEAIRSDLQARFRNVIAVCAVTSEQLLCDPQDTCEHTFRVYKNVIAKPSNSR